MHDADAHVVPVPTIPSGTHPIYMIPIGTNPIVETHYTHTTPVPTLPQTIPVLTLMHDPGTHLPQTIRYSP